jgi:predicted nucleotidyltransferase
MPPMRINHQNIADRVIATALSEFVEDRTQILNRLTQILLSEPAIRAAWMWGSFGRGSADDLSDLDIWVAVADELMPEIVGRLLGLLPAAGEWIVGGENSN